MNVWFFNLATEINFYQHICKFDVLKNNIEQKVQGNLTTHVLILQIFLPIVLTYASNPFLRPFQDIHAICTGKSLLKETLRSVCLKLYSSWWRKQVVNAKIDVLALPYGNRNTSMVFIHKSLWTHSNLSVMPLCLSWQPMFDLTAFLSLKNYEPCIYMCVVTVSQTRSLLLL